MTPQSQKSSYTLDEVMQMYSGGQQQIQPSIQAAQENTSNVPFPAQGNEGGLKSGAKAAGNYIPSIYNFGKGLVDVAKSVIKNPKESFQFAEKLVKENTPLGVAGNLVSGKGLSKPATEQAVQVIGESFNQRYGTSFGPEEFNYDTFLDRSQKTTIEDPFGVGTDILSAVSGGAGAFGKGAAVSKAIGTVGGAVTSPIARSASGFSDKVARTARFGVSQATGLSPETVSTIARNRGAFSEAQAAGTTRTDLAENVLGAVKKAQDDLGDLGSGYDTIRQTQASVSLPENWVQSSLDKYGLKFQNTKVSADRTSATRNVTDINKIQEFIDNWGDSRTLTPEEYLNMRHDLAELAKYDMSGKSTVVRQFAQDVREGILNSDDVRGQIPGLKDLDTKYAADKTFLTKIEKDFIDPKTGNLKDGAASKVVNAVNAANPERLARLEQLYPGFTQQAKVVKAIEDIENTMGIKTGTYVRAGVGISAAVSGNLPLVVAAILSTPEIAVPLIKGYGWTAEQVAPVLKVARDIASDINNFRVPGAVEQYFKDNYKDGVPVGLSIKNSVTPEKVAQNLSLEDYRTLNEYLLNPADTKYFGKAQTLMEKIGIDKADEATQTKFLNEVKVEYDSALNRGESFNQGATPQTTALLEEAKGKTFDEFMRAQGTPVYHGTNRAFDSFDINAPKQPGHASGAFAKGISFTPVKEYADKYAQRAVTREGGNAVVKEAVLNLKKPFIIDSESKLKQIAEMLGIEAKYKYKATSPADGAVDLIIDGGGSERFTQKLKELGYDGVIAKQEFGDEYIVFDPKTIKTRTQLEDIWKQANQ